jgi:dTDP-4-dehydrorhamnose reductase
VKRYLITGVSGMLGINLALHLAEQAEVVGVVNNHPLQNAPFQTVSADLSQAGAAERLLEKVQPQAVINCAAMANIDECELKPDLAYRMNSTLPGMLAKVTKKHDIRFLHISTDAVFDGRAGRYNEMDLPNPVNLYGHTKLAGEQAVEGENDEALVARVNFYGWSIDGRRGLAEWFYNNLAAGNSIKGFTDVFFCPLLANDLAKILVRMLEESLSGLYHVVSRDHLSKYEFGCRVARQFGLDEKLIQPASWTTGLLKAGRSPNLTLVTNKLEYALSEELPSVDEGIQRFHELFLQGYPQKLAAFGMMPEGG